MAYVHITDSIRRDVSYTIRDIYNKKKDAIMARLQNLPLADEIYEAEHGKYVPLIEQLPKKWFTTSSCMSVSVTGAKGYGVQFQSHFVGYHQRPVPAIEVNGPYRLSPGCPSYAAAVELVDQHCATCIEENKLLHVLVGQVLTSCTSLKHVLEIWPTALEYMPDYVKERHNKVTGKARKKRSVPDITIDDDIKIAIAKHRLTKGA